MLWKLFQDPSLRKTRRERFWVDRVFPGSVSVRNFNLWIVPQCLSSSVCYESHCWKRYQNFALVSLLFAPSPSPHFKFIFVSVPGLMRLWSMYLELTLPSSLQSYILCLIHYTLLFVKWWIYLVKKNKNTVTPPLYKQASGLIFFILWNPAKRRK